MPQPREQVSPSPFLQHLPWEEPTEQEQHAEDDDDRNNNGRITQEKHNLTTNGMIPKKSGGRILELSFDEPIMLETEPQSMKNQQATSTSRGEIGMTNTAEKKKFLDRPMGLETTEGEMPIPPIISQRTQT